MEKKYRLTGYIMLLLIPLVFAGFYKTYFEKFPRFGEHIRLFDHLHALIASAWILMLVVQPILVANKKYETHRRLGRISYFVFALLLLSFIPQIQKTIRAGNLKNLFFPLSDMCVLIILYLLAIYHKKYTPKHMRYMITSALVLLGPTVGRIGPLLFGWPELLTQNIQYTLIYAVLLCLLWYDRKKITASNPYVVALGLFLLHQFIFYLLFL
ncbi:MAG TPA: hypothetical protein PLZ45_00995 [Ferruginibacter sp.]|nr:hypothetical protein [Ferruginibacter sp.]